MKCFKMDNIKRENANIECLIDLNSFVEERRSKWNKTVKQYL